MITPPTDSYFMLHLSDEAAEFAASVLSLSAMNDIREAVLVSIDFESDIEAGCAFDDTVHVLKDGILQDTIEYETFNPIWLPSTPEELEGAFDSDEGKTDTVNFTAVDGSPFTMKLTTIAVDDREVMTGKLVCKPFEMPSYTDMMQEHRDMKVN